MEKELDQMTEEELIVFSEKEVNDDEETPVDPEEVDTKPETPEDDDQTTDPPAADTEEETPDFAEIFDSSGLSKQFPGGIGEMIERMPETNKYLRTLQDDNKKFRDYMLEQTKPKDPKPPTAEEFHDNFNDDPEKTLKDRGFIDNGKFEETSQRVSKIENDILYNQVANIVGEYDDLKDISHSYRLQKDPPPGQNAIWDTIMKMVDQNPGLENVPLATKLNLLYDKAKDVVSKTNKSKPPVKPLSAEQRDAAKTTKPDGSGGSSINLEEMSADELLDYARKNNKYAG